MLENTEELIDFSQAADQEVDPISYAKDCLLSFIQENMTGPLTESSRLCATLEIQGEQLAEGTKSSALLEQSSQILYASEESALWTARCGFVHQQVLIHPVEFLENLVLSSYAKFFSESLESPDLAIYCIEYALCFLYYSKYDQAEEYLKKAQSLAGISLYLIDKIGMYSTSQKSETAQEGLEVSSSNFEQESLSNSTIETGLLVKETESLELPESDEKETLTELEQLIILGWVQFFFKTGKELGTEIISDYLERTLVKSSDRLIYLTALFLHSTNLSQDQNNIERRILQLGQLTEEYSDSSVTTSSTYYFALAYPPRHKLFEALGQVFMKRGELNSALDLFGRAGMWEEAIKCLVAENQLEKAKELAQTRLSIESSPQILCCLGDMTRDPSYYYQAWELSTNRDSRAMRSLGKLFFERSELNNAIECYCLALELNPLYPDSWLTLGCAYLEIDNLPRAAEAFEKIVSIDDKFAEGWNYLGTCYLKLGKDEEAFEAFTRGVYFDRENWHMWGNLLTLSLKTGELSTCLESIRALIKLKHTELLGNDVLEAINSYSKQTECTEQISSLYEEVLSQVSTNGLIWMKYAEFVNMHKGKTEEFDLNKVLELRIKACRTEMKIGWDKDHSICRRLLPMFEILAHSYALSSNNKRFEGRMFLSTVYRKINALLGTNHDFPKF